MPPSGLPSPDPSGENPGRAGTDRGRRSSNARTPRREEADTMRDSERRHQGVPRHNTFRRRASFAAPVVIVLVAGGCGAGDATSNPPAPSGSDTSVTSPSTEVPSTFVANPPPVTDPSSAPTSAITSRAPRAPSTSGAEASRRVANPASPGPSTPSADASRQITNPPPPAGQNPTPPTSASSGHVVANPPPPPSGGTSEPIVVTNPPPPPTP